MLIALSHAPFDNTFSLEALELCLGLSSVGLPIELLFINDGVYHLIANQNACQLPIKNFLKNLNSLELYDITQVYVCEQSIIARHINFTELNIANIQLVSNALDLLETVNKSLIL
jgi:tRNA 2-thiouridine synthesizing protein C